MATTPHIACIFFLAGRHRHPHRARAGGREALCCARHMRPAESPPNQLKARTMARWKSWGLPSKAAISACEFCPRLSQRAPSHFAVTIPYLLLFPGLPPCHIFRFAARKKSSAVATGPLAADGRRAASFRRDTRHRRLHAAAAPSADRSFTSLHDQKRLRNRSGPSHSVPASVQLGFQYR